MGRIARRWGAAGGYREFLGLALPLILSTASWSIQHFVDRVFLSWYSTEALAAALPAGMANFTFISLFMGTAQYANTFVAQYMGARRLTRVGPAVWQGAYVALFSGLLALLPAAFAGELFAFIGHDPGIRAAETQYFRILCYGTGPQVLSTAFSCFFSGRGQTWVVLAVNVVAISVNIICDYALIFGHWGLPELGIVGAAWATNIGLVVSALCFAVLFLGPRYRSEYATLRGWKPDLKLLLRLLRYGGPNGVNFMLDIMAFTFFLFIVGRLGPIPLAATNLAFHINSLAFMPLIGCSIAVSTMVGQRLGRDQPEAAEYCTWSGFHLAMLYMGTMSCGLCLGAGVFPGAFWRGRRRQLCGRASDRRGLAALRGLVLRLRRRLYGIRGGPEGRGRHPLRHVDFDLAGLGDHGRAVFRRSNLFRRGAVPDLELWLRVYMRLGRGSLLALSHGPLEEYAGY